MKNTRIEEITDNNSYIYLMKKNISGLSLYDKTKVVTHFTKHDTKVLEECVDNKIKEILASKNIYVKSTDKEDIGKALWELRNCGYLIEIIDRYEEVEDLVKLGVFNGMTVVVEDDNSLACAIEIKLMERWKELYGG